MADNNIHQNAWAFIVVKRFYLTRPFLIGQAYVEDINLTDSDVEYSVSIKFFGNQH